MSHRSGRRRGFTLVEVMVSVAILTMVGAMLYSTIRVALTSQKTAQQIHAVYHSGWVAMNKMVKDITNAFISKHVGILERNRETLFVGKEDELLFTYLGHYQFYPEEPESDQGVVEYSLERKKLIRREKTQIDDSPDKGGNEDVLATGVKELEFNYWDPDQEDWVDDWRAEFEDTDPIFLDKTEQKANDLAKKMTGMDQLDDFKLPPRVRIRLVLVDEEGREFPFESEAQIVMRDPFSW
jgi:general secretion pathway protein J